jgi:hypothetical protein
VDALNLRMSVENSSPYPASGPAGPYMPAAVACALRGLSAEMSASAQLWPESTKHVAPCLLNWTRARMSVKCFSPFLPHKHV